MATPDSRAPGSPDDTTACRIISDLDSSFIVEAGAGTGKTYALVSRVIALVKAGPQHGGARMEHIVAITFTEAAAAELSERIRSRMEQLLDASHPDNAGDLLFPLSGDERERLTVAIEELDQATIQTIHSFAGQLLRERPMDVGLPPGWLQLDALAASQRFDERWDSWLEWALGNGADVPADLQSTLRYLLSANIGIARWQSIARAFSEHYEKLRADHAVQRYDLAPVVQQTLEDLQELIAGCNVPSDRLYQQLAGAIATVTAVSQVADYPPAAAQVLEQGAPVDYSRSVGVQKNWSSSPQTIRDDFREIGRAFQETVRASALAILLRSLRAQFAVEYEAERKSDGVVTFTDLLVWARDLLRDNAAARHHFQRKYSHILIDEFQDTDPLQAEIAFYLAAAPDADVIHQPWHTLPLSTGKLFLVGDSKQSIYRFRGADVSITARVKAGGQLQELTLTENRRSQQRVLDWVNATFSQIMVEADDVEADDKAPPVQAEYRPLAPHAAIQQPSLGSVTVFGGPVAGAAATRRMRSQHIVRLIAAGISDGGRRLQVYDRATRQPRPASRRDVCILIRERTGLGILQWELDMAGIPYRIEGGSLLFDTQEVQDLLNCLQAIDDPTDAICVAAALRAPAFACSDAELLRWKDAGGPWDYRSVPRDEAGQRQQQSERRQRLLAVSPVWAAMGVLRDYHGRRQSLTVAALISEFVRERRLEELDLSEYRAREIWRRRQFIIEQARSLEAASADTVGQSSWNLHQFIRWANHQRDEHSRITETAVPESDDDAVRIMTMHSAKGLEFPIVILQDLDIAARPRPPERVLFNSESDTLEVYASNRNAATVRTGGYARIEEEEKRHAAAEKIRLAYVAATRARDHLLVSLYHADRSEPDAWDADQAAAIVGLPGGLPHTALSPDDGASIAFALSQAVATPPPLPPYDAAAWQAERTASIRSRSVQQAVTATWLARQGAAADGDRPAGNVPAGNIPAGNVPGVHQPATLPEPAALAEIEDKEGEPDPEQPWRKGRGATAFGSAVHAVLQGVVEELSPQLPLPGDADLDALLAARHPDILRLANVHTAAQEVPTRRDEVVALVERALRNPEVVAALRAQQRWPELPVAAPVDTSRGPVVIEGIIDLLYEDAAGELVILDYKSDDVRSESDVASRMSHYKYQGAAYAAAVERATGRRVSAVKFLFLRTDSVQAIEDIPNLIGQLPALMTGAGA